MKTNSYSAAKIWAEALGDVDVSSYGALTFEGTVAWSYAEPLAVIDPETKTVFVTRGRFSVTTSKHLSIVMSGIHRAGGFDIQDRSHGRIRKLARGQGQGWKLGARGAHYEAQYERNVGVAA